MESEIDEKWSAALVETSGDFRGEVSVRSTLRVRLDELARMFGIEPPPAWSTHVR